MRQILLAPQSSNMRGGLFDMFVQLLTFIIGIKIDRI